MSRYPFGLMNRLFDVVLRCTVAGLLLLAVTGVCGCSSWKPHAKAAAVAYETIATSGSLLDTACPEDADVDRARRCLRAFEAHDVARAAYRVYADTVLLMIDGEWDLGRLLPLGIALVDAYRQVTEAAAEFDTELPALPDLLGGDR